MKISIPVRVLGVCIGAGLLWANPAFADPVATEETGAAVVAADDGPSADPCPGSEPLVLATRLEKTFLRIDVLDLELRVGGEAAERVRKWSGSGRPQEAEADRVARILIDARCADATQVFLRSVGLGRFLKAIRSNMHRAREAGFLDAVDEERIAASLPASYAFLAEEGIAKGDRMHYEVRGDSLHILYTDTRGVVRLDQVDVGPAHRRALLGGFLAPGSDFREGLLRSFFEEDGSGPVSAEKGPR